MVQGVAAIFHSHLQLCLDVTWAKPAKPKKEKGVKKIPKKRPKEVFIACLI